jgi:small-conductance mechanosensitive channel
LIQRLTPHEGFTQTILQRLVFTLVQSSKFFFILTWSLYAGMAFHSVSPAVEQNSDRFIFLISILQLGIWSNSILTLWIEHSIKSKLAEDAAGISTLGLVRILAKIGLYSVLALLTLNQFGVNITALAAGLGVGGIAVALAVQNILGDLFASLTILLDKPFIVGDQIWVDEWMGYVEQVGLKTTRLRSLTGEQLIFPNGDLLKNRIRNFKRMEKRRLTFLVHVPYSTSTEKLQKIPKILQSAIASQKELTRLERTYFKAFGVYALEYETVYWVIDSDLNIAMQIQGNINLEIVRRFRNERIQFAYLAQPIATLATESIT